MKIKLVSGVIFATIIMIALNVKNAFAAPNHMVAYDISPVLQIGVIMTAFLSLGIVLGFLYFAWESVKAIFGKIPFIGDKL